MKKYCLYSIAVVFFVILTGGLYAQDMDILELQESVEQPQEPQTPDLVPVEEEKVQISTKDLTFEDIAKLYAEAWMNRDVDSLYGLVDQDNITLEKFTEMVKYKIGNDLLPTAFIKIDNVGAEDWVEFTVKVPRAWNSYNNIAQFRLYFTQDKRGDWRIIGEQRIDELGAPIRLYYVLPEEDQLKCEFVVRTYVDALCHGDINSQMACFLQRPALTRKQYIINNLFVLKPKNWPLRFLRIERMNVLPDGMVEVGAVMQVPPTWDVNNNVYMLRIFLMKLVSGDWRIIRVVG